MTTKELGRIKTNGGWIIIYVFYDDYKEIMACDNSRYCKEIEVKFMLRAIPFFGIEKSRRLKKKGKLKSRCQRNFSDYMALKKIINLVTEYLEKTKPQYVMIGAIVDKDYNKREKLYIKIMNRAGYKMYDSQFIRSVHDLEGFYSYMWLMERNV